MGGNLRYAASDTITYNPFIYTVELTLYRNTHGAILPDTVEVLASSSCYPTQTIKVVRYLASSLRPTGDGGSLPSQYFDCTDSMQSVYRHTSIHTYKAEIQLPGKCKDFYFAYSQCCRENGIVNGPAATNFYLEAMLDNRFGANRSPKILRQGMLEYCLGKRGFGGYEYLLEPDMDSMRVVASQAQSARNTLVPFADGYSVDTPFASQNGITFHDNPGFHFIPSVPGYFTYNIIIEEYRFDSTNYHKISSIPKELTFKVSDNCSLGSLYTELSTDYPNVDTQSEALCFDSIISFVPSVPIWVGSIAADGSDFIVLDPFGKILEVDSAYSDYPFSDEFGMTTKIVIEVSNPLRGNQTLEIVTKQGADGNTLINTCGEEIAAGKRAKVAVDNCANDAGVLRVQSDGAVFFYPNPVIKELYVYFSDNAEGLYEFRFYDMSGRFVQVSSLDPQSEDTNILNCEKLNKGLYILSISKNGEVISSTKIEKN